MDGEVFYSAAYKGNAIIHVAIHDGDVVIMDRSTCFFLL